MGGGSKYIAAAPGAQLGHDGRNDRWISSRVRPSIVQVRVSTNSTVSARHLCLENMSSRGLSLVALVLVSVFCTGASSAADIPLAGYGVNGLEWRAEIDPVMGGNSDGTFSPVTLPLSASLVNF